ncbi:ABC transporter permease [Nonomuraea sp. K274]|uniref:ABC transporter permease n=1 Tax=Nonomuraea cypriaca TaxID=1187855 RepID=A0A931AKG6_9ACTN|nr:ABC transporter permease [Nonomuraea cypriaca]MBF8191830.1 ABC transporter permease [Nonomuraea cypriaca]
MTAVETRRRPAVARGWPAVIGFGVPLAVIVLLAVFAGLLPLQDPNQQNLANALLPPGLDTAGGVHHYLGTDQLGRDMLARMVYGARLSLMIGFVAMFAGAVPGIILGLVAGYYRGWFDAVVSRLIDAQLAIPFVLLAIAVMATHARSVPVLIVVLAMFSWAPYARVIRAETLGLREQTFVLSLRSAGVSSLGIVFRHILPNVAGTAFVLATLQVGSVMLAESALSFLGLGVVEPSVSWGAMLADGRDEIVGAWWIAAFPGLVITVTVLLVNLFGDALRPILDPRHRGF